MSEWLANLERYSGEGGWVIQVFIVVFLVLLFNYIQRRLLTRLHKHLSETRHHWDDALVEALRRPLTLLIWIVGITFAAEIVQHETDAAIFALFGPARDVGVIVCLGWFLIRLTNSFAFNLVRHKEAQGEIDDKQTIDAITKLVRVSIMITAGLVILQTLGFSISGVLAFGGIGGIAIGFAAKDLLANFFGGLIIYLDRPFAVGDWIRSPDRDIEGTVEQIGWRLTCIRSFDKRPIYVPNATFNTIVVVNPSRMSHRRINETIGIRYDDADKMDQIVKSVKEMLQSHDEIDQSQTLMVNFNSFAASSLDFFIYTFTRTTNWQHYHEVKHDVLMRVYAIIREQGADVAFPTTTVHVPEGVQLNQQDGNATA